jgi:phosphopantetheinyl transferase
VFSREKYLFGQTTVELLHFDDFDPSSFTHQLTAIELERFFEFTNIKRKREFVATRMLRHELFGFQHIHYDAVGAPYIEGIGNISISHTNNCVGIAYSKEYKVGLDLEIIKPQIIAISHKFLNEEEKEIFDSKNSLSITKLWTIKEVLYKLSGKKELSFLKNLHVKSNFNDMYEGLVEKDSFLINVKIAVKQLNDIILAVNIEACES